MDNRKHFINLAISAGTGLLCGFLGHQTRPIVNQIMHKSRVWGMLVNDGIGSIILLPGGVTAYEALPELSNGRRFVVASVMSWMCTGTGVLLGYVFDSMFSADRQVHAITKHNV